MSNSTQEIFAEAIQFESSRLAHFGQSGHIQSFSDAVSGVIVEGVIDHSLLEQAKSTANDVVRDALDGFVRKVLDKTAQPG